LLLSYRPFQLALIEVVSPFELGVGCGKAKAIRTDSRPEQNDEEPNHSLLKKI